MEDIFLKTNFENGLQEKKQKKERMHVNCRGLIPDM